MWRVSMIWLWDLSCLKQYKDSDVWGLRPKGGSAFNETDFLAKNVGENIEHKCANTDANVRLVHA